MRPVHIKESVYSEFGRHHLHQPIIEGILLYACGNLRDIPVLDSIQAYNASVLDSIYKYKDDMSTERTTIAKCRDEALWMLQRIAAYGSDLPCHVSHAIVNKRGVYLRYDPTPRTSDI